MQYFATYTCEPIDSVVQSAFEGCHQKWAAEVRNAVGTAPADLRNIDAAEAYVARLKERFDATKESYQSGRKPYAMAFRAAVNECRGR